MCDTYITGIDLSEVLFYVTFDLSFRLIVFVVWAKVARLVKM